jgi:hypothetical protein
LNSQTRSTWIDFSIKNKDQKNSDSFQWQVILDWILGWETTWHSVSSTASGGSSMANPFRLFHTMRSLMRIFLQGLSVAKDWRRRHCFSMKDSAPRLLKVLGTNTIALRKTNPSPVCKRDIQKIWRRTLLRPLRKGNIMWKNQQEQRVVGSR